MKEHLILKDFYGSQDGIDGESFVAGTTRMISDSLAQALGGSGGGYIREASEAARDIASATPELADAVKEAIADASAEDSGEQIEGDATEAETEATPEDAEEKSEGDAPKNKAKKAAPSNKVKK